MFISRASVALLLPFLLSAGRCLAGGPTSRPQAAAWEILALPLVDGYRDPNAIVYDAKRLKALENLAQYYRLDKVTCMLGRVTYTVVTPSGVTYGTICTAAPRIMYFKGPFHSKHLVRFLERRAAGQPPPGMPAGPDGDNLREMYDRDVADVIEIVGTANLKPALPVLMRLLHDERLQADVVDALGYMGPDAADAVDALLPLLAGGDFADPHPSLTGQTLAKIGPAALPRLLKIAEDEKDSRRVDAILALGEMGEMGAPVVPTLTKILEGSDERPSFNLRAAALRAIAGIGPAASATVPSLIPIAREAKSPDEERLAVKAIGHIGPAAKAAIPVLLDEGWWGERGRIWALVEIGPEGLAAALRAAKDPFGRRCIVGACEMASAARLQEALPVLLSFLNDPDLEVRRDAIEVVAWRGPIDVAVPALAQRLKDPEPNGIKYLSPRRIINYNSSASSGLLS